MIKEIETTFIDRVLLSLLDDVQVLEAGAKDIRVKINALAREHGIKISEAT